MRDYINILTNEERALVPAVLERRRRFQKVLNLSIKNYDNIFSNSLLIQGKPGTGKTTLVAQYLDKLKENKEIAGWVRASGHITPSSLYKLLYETRLPNVNGKPYVLVLDDVDCLADQGCLELLKAAFDTKSDTPTNREVYYMTERSSGFKYRGFGIIITNNEFNPDRVTVHQEALLDRVQWMSIDLEKTDAAIYNTYLVEDYLNKNPDMLKEEELKEAAKLFQTDVRKWLSTNAFAKARVNFSIRLIKKFLDYSKMFGEDWKDFSTTYNRLNMAADLVEAQVPVQNAYINPRTGKPYSTARIYQLKKEGKLA